MPASIKNFFAESLQKLPRSSRDHYGRLRWVIVTLFLCLSQAISPSFSKPLRYQYVGSEVGNFVIWASPTKFVSL